MDDKKNITIKLNNGKTTLINVEDLDLVKKYKWQCCNGYASRSSSIKIDDKWKKIQILLHREIMNCPYGFEVDHINRNKLDNRRCNLRIVSKSINLHNCKISKNNTSGVNGISWNKASKKWVASISVFGKRIFLGYFDNKNIAEKRYFEEFYKHYE